MIEYAIRNKKTDYVFESPLGKRQDRDWHVRWIDVDGDPTSAEVFEIVERDVTDWRVTVRTEENHGQA